MDINEAIEKAWNMVKLKFDQDNDKKSTLHWNEEVLMLYFFHFLDNLEIEIGQVASKEEFYVYPNSGGQPDLVFSVKTNGKVQRAVLEFKSFRAKETQLEDDWKRLEKFREIFFNEDYVDCGYLLAFTSFDFKKDVKKINGYEMRALTYKVSPKLSGSGLDIAHGIMRKVFRKRTSDFRIGEKQNPWAVFQDYSVLFYLNEVGMDILVSFEKRPKGAFERLGNELRKRGYSDEMLKMLESKGILLLNEDDVMVTDNDYNVAKIKALFAKFEKDYSEIRERLSARATKKTPTSIPL